jgi:hypothetical protein
MSMQERFSDEEWPVLIGLPAQLLMMVGMVDGEFDAKEREEANKRLTRAAAADPDPLYRELASAMFRSGTSLESDMARANPARCREILQDNLSREEYQRFLMSVFVDALAVAKASTKARRNPFRPKPDVVSDEEKQILAAWASFYDMLGG